MFLLSILLHTTLYDEFILHTTSLHWRTSLAEDNNWLGSNRRPATQPPKIRLHSRCAGMTKWISIIPEECADPLSWRVAILVRHLTLLTSPTSRTHGYSFRERASPPFSRTSSSLFWYYPPSFLLCDSSTPANHLLPWRPLLYFAWACSIEREINQRPEHRMPSRFSLVCR